MGKQNVQKVVEQVLAIDNLGVWLSKAEIRERGSIHPDAEITARCRDLRDTYNVECARQDDGVYRYRVTGLKS